MRDTPIIVEWTAEMESWEEEFHKAAMTYRAAFVLDAPEAYDTLLGLALALMEKK